MIDVRHYANSQQVNPLGERANEPFSLEIEMDWLNQKADARIPATNLTFEGKDGALIKNRALSGLSGGLGVFEGMPYTVQVGSVTDFQQFDMYIDFTKDLQFVGECGVNVSIQQKGGTDWLNDVADGIPFAYLYDIGVITDADFISIPYVINYIPDGQQLIVLSLATYSLTRELIEGIKAIAFRIATLTNAATPVVGASVGLGAGVVTAWDIGDYAGAALELIAQIAATGATVVALVLLVDQVIEQLMPPKRFHKGIPFKVLMQKFCDHKGLRLQSTLLDAIDKTGNKWCYLPPKNHRGGERPTAADSSWYESGLPDVNSSIYNAGGLIRELKKMFNADYKIQDGVFIFERKDGFELNNPYIIPDTLTDQQNLVNVNGFNTGDLVANYNVFWQSDIQDQNTLDNIEGLSFQLQTTPKRTSDPTLTNIQGLESISLPFALPVRKDKLSAVEEAVKALATLLDAVTGQLGNPQSLSGKINNRIGSLNLSSHFTSAGKVVVMAGKKLQKDQRAILGAGNLWDKYHYINSFAEINGKHGQYYLYKEKPIPFCFEDYLKIKQSNVVYLETGEQAKIERLLWSVYDGTATIDYRVNKLYDSNLQTRIL